MTSRDRLAAAILGGIKPLPTIHPAQWSNERRHLPADAAAQSGRFECFPYQAEPLDAPLDEDVIETILWWASQTGKSEIINNLAGYFMEEDPSPQLLVQPTVELYEAYSKERIAPMIRDTPCLRKLVRDPRTRDSGNTVGFKRYPGGSLAMTGANAPAGLAGRPRRVVLLDEVDRFPASAGAEGDPCALADKRTEAFPNAVKVKTSTGTVKGLSKIEKLYEKSDKRKWHVCCRNCRHEFVMMWEHIEWDEGAPETARLVCPQCKFHLNDADRIAMVRAGQWKATAKFRGVRGYWLNGLNTLFRHHKGYRNRLHQFVEEFLKAKDGGAQTMRVWINTFLAETYEEDASKIDAKNLEERTEDYTPDALPERVLIVTAAADVHRDRIELEFKGWARDEESFGIQKKVLLGDTQKDEIWRALDKELLQSFDREDGVRLTISRTFIDMGYRPPRVLAFCAPRIGRGVFPCKGINRVGVNVPPLLPAKPSRNNKARIPHWNVGVTVAKTELHDRVLLPDGPRAMHFANATYGYDDDYFAQFASEKRFLKYTHGQPYYVFEKENNSVRNEALDLNVYNLAAIHSLAPIAWGKVAENLNRKAKVKNGDKSSGENRGAMDRRKSRTRRDDGLPKITKEDLKAAVEAEEPKTAEAPEEKREPEPVNYTEEILRQKIQRRRHFGRGGFVKGW